jgi:hypothetical protein
VEHEGSLPRSQESAADSYILSHMKEVRTIPSDVLKSCFNITPSRNLVLPIGVFSLGFSASIVYAFHFFVLNACHIPRVIIDP